MKIISVWQPFATLLVRGYKVFETRTWSAPKSVIGQRIGIAATKSIVPDQRAFWASEEFRFYHDRLQIEPIEDLPRGALLGTVILDSVEFMDEEFMNDVSHEEQAYGHWEHGNYAWRVVDPVELKEPIPIRGKQGLYDWHGNLNEQAERCEAVGAQGSEDLRRGLRVV